jgi:hypothetical protein
VKVLKHASCMSVYFSCVITIQLITMLGRRPTMVSGTIA